MSGTQKTITWIIAGMIIGAAAVRITTWRASPSKPVVLVGAVLRGDPNPSKQSPISNATVIGISGSTYETTKSDASGLFKLTVHTGVLPDRPITLRFEHAEYQPLEIPVEEKGMLYVVRLEPTTGPTVTNNTEAPDKTTVISNVRVRYSVKNQTTINVGSLVRQFEVVNTGDVPCKGQHPCSPDGKWKAAVGAITLDAQKGNELRNARASCIAGPCPFTRLEPADLSQPARQIQVKALAWSDTASFQVEAEVTSTRTTEMTLQSYPFLTGQTMTFALPPSSEGPSIMADLNGEEIVFPLGPSLIVSWTSCTVEVDPGHNRIYRCELKPGYRFQQ